MKKNIKNKIIAGILIFILSFANFQLILSEGFMVLASYINIQNQYTNHKNVDFNAQFMVFDNEKKYAIRENISNNDIYLNLFAEVKEAGYLKSGKVSIKDENGNKSNFDLIEFDEPNSIQNIDYIERKIELNQINNGEKLDVNIPIKLEKTEMFDLDDFSKNILVEFNGIYIDETGEENEVSKEIKLQTEWKEDIEAILSQKTAKVLPFELETQKGVVIAEELTFGVKDAKLPIKEASLEVIVPKIGEILPTDVRVESINTNLNISKQYDNGRLYLTLENHISEINEVNWNRLLEEIGLTYVFENVENTEILEIESIAKLKLECYSSEKTIVNAETTNLINISNKIGYEIDEITENVLEPIYKGNMIHTKKETEFVVKSNIDIAFEKLIQNVKVAYSKDKFILNENEIDANTYYKKIKILKENFVKLLGIEGEIKIYSGEELVGIINNSLETDESGNIVFDFENDLINQIRIETTKPIYSGILNIEFLKAVKGECGYLKEEIKNISHLKLETVVNDIKKEVNRELKNPTTKISVDTNTNVLSTVVDNTGVEFTVVLKNNELSTDLFKNPKLELRMPEAVTELKINSVELVLEDELVIKDYEYNKSTNSIILNLEGTQTKYNLNELAYGVTLIVNTDIKIDKLAVNKKDKVELFVINENCTSYESVLEEKGYSEKSINIVAPLGLIALNSAEIENANIETTTSISGNEAIGKIEPNSETKVATMKITAINNYDSIINNIRILGRIPFIGNKSLIDGTDLGTNFDAILKDKILSLGLTEENYEIYYSVNGEATESLEELENIWVLEPEDLSKVKSYLIVLKDYNLDIGEKIEFEYKIEVPAGLELGSSAHGTYIVYYDNKKDDVVFQNTSVPTVVGFTTGEAPELEVNINSDIGQTEVAKSGQIIKYTIKLKNTGKVKATQVFIMTDIPEGLTFAELVLGGNYAEDYYKFDSSKKSVDKLIGDLEVGEEKDVEFLVRVNDNLDSKQEIKTKTKLSAKDLPGMIESNEVTNIIDNGTMLIDLKSDIKEDEKVKVGDSIKYIAKITNISDYDMNNVVAKVEIPETITHVNSSEKATYNEDTKTITWNIDRIEKQSYKKIEFEVNAKDESIVELYVKALGDNISEHKSNVYKTNICKSNITVVQESTIPEGYVSIGDKIEYKIKVENTGNLDATNLKIIDILPEGVKYLETTYELNDIKKTIKNSDNNEANLEINVPADSTLNMDVKVKVEETKKDILATNIVKVVNDGVEIEANKLTHKIEAKTLGNSYNEEDEIKIVDTYKISGTAWMDKNGDGIKDNEEAMLAGVTVMLLDKQTGNIAKDVNGQELNTTTEGTGLYTFRNLSKGEYLVVFIYDNSKYELTTYKQTGVEESKNSDVVNMKISMNDMEQTVAVSDNLNITDENIYNINIGLKEISGFDLKLEKYVSKITVKNSKGITEYDYKNTKTAKIEIDSKVANETTLIIEYKLIVTNEGGIAGYAKKVVDYIPQELKFSSELNSSWYLAEDGNVYNSELGNIIINPGESKEISLILTKQITGENTGLINNNAEIAESYNDNGVADLDSIAGNKQTAEDDMSNADIYIGVKTGSPVTYFGLSIILMMILAVGAYLINVKILIRNKEF